MHWNVCGFNLTVCYATLLQLFDAHPLCEKNMVNSIDELTLRCKCIVAVLIKNLGHGVVLCGANLFLEACVMIDETSKTVPARAPHSTVTFRSVLKSVFSLLLLITPIQTCRDLKNRNQGSVYSASAGRDMSNNGYKPCEFHYRCMDEAVDALQCGFVRFI